MVGEIQASSGNWGLSLMKSHWCSMILEANAGGYNLSSRGIKPKKSTAQKQHIWKKRFQWYSKITQNRLKIVARELCPLQSLAISLVAGLAIFVNVLQCCFHLWFVENLNDRPHVQKHDSWANAPNQSPFQAHVAVVLHPKSLAVQTWGRLKQHGRKERRSSQPGWDKYVLSYLGYYCIGQINLGNSNEYQYFRTVAEYSGMSDSTRLLGH